MARDGETKVIKFDTMEEIEAALATCDDGLPPVGHYKAALEALKTARAELAKKSRYELPGTYFNCGRHYYACVRGDEECPVCDSFRQHIQEREQARVEVAELRKALREIAFHVPTVMTVNGMKVCDIEEVFKLKHIAGVARAAIAEGAKDAK